MKTILIRTLLALTFITVASEMCIIVVSCGSGDPDKKDSTSVVIDTTKKIVTADSIVVDTTKK